MFDDLNNWLNENPAFFSDVESETERLGSASRIALAGAFSLPLAPVLLEGRLAESVEIVCDDESYDFWSSLLKLRADYDITILISTPYMDEASWCDRISLIQSGQFMQTNTPEGICRKYSEALLSVRSNDMHRLLSDLKACRLVKNSFAFGDSYHVILHDDASPELLTAALAEKGHNSIKIEKILPSVEDCFMSLMKNATR